MTDFADRVTHLTAEGAYHMMAHLKQAVTIFAEIGVESGSLQPEIWKLSEW
jgi:hypothetical protein